MSKCPECGGSILHSHGVCGDCGLDFVEYINEYEEWLDSLPPIEAYEEAA